MFRAAWGFQEDPAALGGQQIVILQSTSARQDPVDLRSWPKLVFPARLEEPGAGLLPLFPGLFSSHSSGFPAMSQCSWLFPAKGPEKSHHGSSVHQVRSHRQLNPSNS